MSITEHKKKNVGDVDRVLSIATGTSLLAWTGVRLTQKKRGPVEMSLGLTGVLLSLRGLRGHSRVYEWADFDTHRPDSWAFGPLEEGGMRIRRSETITAPEDRIQNHLEELLTGASSLFSHGTFSRAAGSSIHFRSDSGSLWGVFELKLRPGNRGVVVRADFRTDLPKSRSYLFDQEIRRSLHRVKQRLEAGENTR